MRGTTRARKQGSTAGARVHADREAVAEYAGCIHKQGARRAASEIRPANCDSELNKNGKKSARDDCLPPSFGSLRLLIPLGLAVQPRVIAVTAVTWGLLQQRYAANARNLAALALHGRPDLRRCEGLSFQIVGHALERRRPRWS